ncbi:MAG: ABC transporter substrate-binding protein [Betaproteobacteria bacterium]|nr:ABC transporter substrate-binding protein [Betaproteobacteria bacterium]
MRVVVASLLIVATVAAASAAVPQRVVTVGGALTEIAYALGAQELLVGSDTTSYFPAAAEKLPKVGYQRTLSAEGILSLAPDLLILTEEAGPPAVIKQLAATDVSMITLKAGRSVDDIKANVQAIGAALDRQRQANDLIARITAEQYALADLVERQPVNRTVLFILQHSGGAPLVAGTDTAADNIITLSGARNAVAGYRGYKPLTPEAAASLQPDIILTTKRGLAQAGGLPRLLDLPGLALTPAAASGNVIAMDALLLIGFGPRTVQAAIQLHDAYQQLP